MVRTRQGTSSAAAPPNDSDDVEEEGEVSPQVRPKPIPKSTPDPSTPVRKRGKVLLYINKCNNLLL
jgi:hypothetical protein